MDEFHYIYIFWAILPLWLFWIAFGESKRQMGKKRKGETKHAIEFFLQAFFSLIILILAIWVDQNFTPDIAALIPAAAITENVVRWFLYPLMLVAAAWLSSFYKPKGKKTGTIPGSRYVKK